MLAVILTDSLQGFAQQISADEAAIVAKTELLYTKDVDVEIVDIYKFDSLDHTLLYEVVTDAGINVLVTGNMMCMPVVGRYEPYGTGPIFSQFDTLPCGLKYFLQEYKDQVCECFLNPPLSSPNIQEWESMMMCEDVYTPKGLGSVSPLLTTKWGQSFSSGYDIVIDSNAYNHYAPSRNGCEHCKAGCVAVAMAQIMYYWKYPVVLFEEKQFDWCNMSDSLSTFHTNHASEKEAVSWLIYHCGEKANTHYGCDDSESNVHDAKPAFDDYGYNNHSDHQWRILHRGTWVNHIRENLDSGWVVLYGASGGLSNWFPSHAFVCDGYSKDGKFHFNWGWNGKYNDSYFTVDSLCPGNHDYRAFVSALFDLRPPRTFIDYCNYKLFLDTFYTFYYYLNIGSPFNPYEIAPKTFSVLTSVPDISTYPSSWRTIPSGATAEYVAHKEIILQPGFKAERGCDFTARIEPCELCEQQMVTLSFAGNETSQELFDATAIESQTVMIGDTAFTIKPSRLSLFPNPTENTLTIVSPDEIKDLNIFDQMGKQVFRWFVTKRSDDSISINVVDISHGTYIVRIITSDENIHIGRFVKK